MDNLENDGGTVCSMLSTQYNNKLSYIYTFKKSY